MRISASVRRVGHPSETHHIGTWNDSWSQAVPEAYRAVQGLWRRMEQHVQRATERAVAKGANKPASWESRMGLGDPTLRADVERVRASLREARASSNMHEKALDEAVGLRQHLLPWTPSEHHTSAASAVTRASIRQRLADMPAKERNAYIGRENLSDETVRALARRGIRHLDVVCPGFSVDCLETLEEIAIENAGFFREAGGTSLRYIPALNADAAHAQALVALIDRHLGS